MIYECTECDTIIPQGKSWVFGKDYLFCSTECRRIFLLRNPDIQNNITIPCRMPEQTHLIMLVHLYHYLVKYHHHLVHHQSHISKHY